MTTAEPDAHTKAPALLPNLRVAGCTVMRGSEIAGDAGGEEATQERIMAHASVPPALNPSVRASR